MKWCKNAVELSHYFAEKLVPAGGVAVDATAGNGHDTLFLAQCAGAQGKVFAFDVDPVAIANTEHLLMKHGGECQVRLILDSHENAVNYIADPVDYVIFNLGYRPGADHQHTTMPESTIKAVKGLFERVRPGGAIGICTYWGIPRCRQEALQLEEHLKSWDQNVADVLVFDFINQKNQPPKFFLIYKKKREKE